ncbi:type II toxin-antitoxin system VapC family toxin [Adlercreutzia faecimuris]|uniref:PIN domain-containing protein n=1 Tax=Adlercreutzia faecimuris TaxID=2897341 RepID=A0ABS9WDC1_9ACTN|nr:PIN domain-containing protein [Adlercreutzia sp. JBNU-10]MCI2240804.1 PIN domain-containing protein [Adlercreutzia sp. JBNU-10]
MVLMLDANIVIDHIGRREPFYELSRRVCLLGITGEAATYISTNMATDIYYLLRKDYGSQEAQRMIEEDLSFLALVGVDPQDVHEALALRWGDFEDCLVAQCARKIGADYIITRNTRDFTRSSIKALTPEQLFEELAARGLVYEEIDW